MDDAEHHSCIGHFRDAMLRQLYRKTAAHMDFVIEPLILILCLIFFFLVVFRLVTPECLNTHVSAITYPVP